MSTESHLESESLGASSEEPTRPPTPYQPVSAWKPSEEKICLGNI